MRVGDNGTILHFEEGMQFTTNLVWTKTTSTASVVLFEILVLFEGSYITLSRADFAGFIGLINY